MRRVVITGGGGFIGRRLASRLRAHGDEVLSLSRSTGFDVLVDEPDLSGVDHVYHLAGLTYVPRAWEDPAAFHLVNAHGAFRIFDQCRRASVSATYVSAYVYGQPASLPIKESDPPKPNNPYAFSKLAGEHAALFFHEVYRLSVSILRLFNVYGAGQAPSFLFPEIARQVLDPQVREIVVADLAPRRDFVHVEDVVDALLDAPRLPSGKPFNVGSGRSHSVAEVIGACLRAAQIEKPFRGRQDVRPGEINDVVADISAIQAAIRWRPTIDLDEGAASVMKGVKA